MSATPHDCIMVESVRQASPKISMPSLRISSSPIRISAALELAPRPRPSAKPAASATTFFSAPHSSTPGTSETSETRKLGWSNSCLRTSALALMLYPIVVSQKSPRATSFATLAPISTLTSIPPSCSEILVERSEMPVSVSSTPLISDTAMASLCICCLMIGVILSRNWCGMTTMRSVASRTASAMSATARTFEGSVIPGRYLTFSCLVLMMSVSFWPSTISSCTHIGISFSKRLARSGRATFSPHTRAIVEPQLPDPIRHTFSRRPAPRRPPPPRNPVSSSRSALLSLARISSMRCGNFICFFWRTSASAPLTASSSTFRLPLIVASGEQRRLDTV
mmetsp:Transcript_11883/g.27840  ORF Transcript_11883/g.27840 Transcript_11883/m.27840 type:complete len:337 (-) Transcript_11883:36-1046(-)